MSDVDLEALKNKLKETLSNAGLPADLLAHVDAVFAEGTKVKAKVVAPEPEEEEEPEISPLPDEDEEEDDPPPKRTIRRKRR